jgi:hydrogenase expression/formation protein HypC
MCLAIPGKLHSVEGDDELTRTGEVSFGGALKRVNLAFVPEARPGDYVLVHVGVALQTIAEDEAAKVFAYLEEIGGLEELDEPQGPSAAGAT